MCSIAPGIPESSPGQALPPAKFAHLTAMDGGNAESAGAVFGLVQQHRGDPDDQGFQWMVLRFQWIDLR